MSDFKQLGKALGAVEFKEANGELHALIHCPKCQGTFSDSIAIHNTYTLPYDRMRLGLSAFNSLTAHWWREHLIVA